MGDGTTFEWHDRMLTGVAEIDHQHRFLVDTLGEARTRLGGESASPLFEQITRDLLAYAIYHFATEEGLMQQHGYARAAPAAAASHLAQHRRFSEQVVALREAARLGEDGAQAALLSFLEGWLVDHILNTDQALGRFLCAATPGPQAGGVR